MSINVLGNKQHLAKEIQELEAEGKRLAARSDANFVPGQSTPFTVAVARQHVAVTTKRRELASIIRREAGLQT